MFCLVDCFVFISIGVCLGLCWILLCRVIATWFVTNGMFCWLVLFVFFCCNWFCCMHCVVGCYLNGLCSSLVWCCWFVLFWLLLLTISFCLMVVWYMVWFCLKCLVDVVEMILFVLFYFVSEVLGLGATRIKTLVNSYFQ